MSAKYHVNPATGKTGLCRAQEGGRGCDFGEHFSNEHDAMKHSEKQFTEKSRILDSSQKMIKKPQKQHYEKPEFVSTVKMERNGIESSYHLYTIDSVKTWCYESGAIIKDQDTLNFIQANLPR